MSHIKTAPYISMKQPPTPPKRKHMNSSLPLAFGPRQLRRVTWMFFALWTLAIAASALWNVRLLHNAMLDAAERDARSSFNRDALYLLNINNMTREEHELKAQEDGTLGHITSLKTKNSKNAPDAWETAALRSFEQGRTEAISRVLNQGQPYLRFMKPLVVEAACLQCHGDQGYHKGDIRGGISVAVPLNPYLTLASNRIWHIADTHAGLWVLGALGIFLGARQMRRRLDQQLQAEEALHRSETKFRTLYDSTSDAVMLLDEKGFFDCNQATLAVFGCATREEFCSKHPADVSPPVQPDGTDSLTLASQRIATAMEKGSHHFEWMYKRAGTGETFPADVLLSAVELDGKRVLQAVVRDITRRKELEAQMERLRAEHALVLNSIGEGVHWIDVDGRIKFENPAAAKMLGYKTSELVGKPAHATMHHTRADGAAYPQSECLIYATLRDGVVRRVTDEVFWRKDGSSFAVEYLCTPIYDKNGRSGGSVVIFADITGRKRLEAQLFQSQKLETVGKLAGGVAHEFNSILTAIIGHSELMLRIFLPAIHLSKMRPESAGPPSEPPR